MSHNSGSHSSGSHNSGSAPAWSQGRVLEVAPQLLGAVIRHAGVAVRLTEVEAYDGANDPGSHAFPGRTPRNTAMFGPPGRLYVYFSYGMHHCANIVVGALGDPAAVLMRSGEVIEGIDVARARRGNSTDRDLARGPARLCQALALDRTHNGLAVDLEIRASEAKVVSGPRVGLTLAADRPWRFWIEGDKFVSAYRRSPRAVD